jgi:hypothetical protein
MDTKQLVDFLLEKRISSLNSKQKNKQIIIMKVQKKFRNILIICFCFLGLLCYGVYFHIKYLQEEQSHTRLKDKIFEAYINVKFKPRIDTLEADINESKEQLDSLGISINKMNQETATLRKELDKNPTKKDSIITAFIARHKKSQ